MIPVASRNPGNFGRVFERHIAVPNIIAPRKSRKTAVPPKTRAVEFVIDVDSEIMLIAVLSPLR